MVFGWFPRDTQLLTVFLAFTKENRKNKSLKRKRLFQVGTGEGKSVIVNLITCIEYLYYNCNIDIVTSQNLLAQRDSQDQSEYYQLIIGIKCGFLDPVIHSLDPMRKKIYSNTNPIYGTAFEYEGDLLRDNEHDIRGKNNAKRLNETCIIDEVDNQFIDDILGSIRLSSPTAGMREFNLLFIIIWNRLKLELSYLENLIVIDNNLYSAKSSMSFDTVLLHLNGINFNHDNDNKKDLIMTKIWQQILGSRLLTDISIRKKYGFTNDIMSDFSNVNNYIELLLNSNENKHIYCLLSFLTHNKINLLDGKIAFYQDNNGQITFKRYFENGNAFKEPLKDSTNYKLIFYKKKGIKQLLLLTLIKETKLKIKTLRRIQRKIFDICKINYYPRDLIQYNDDDKNDDDDEDDDDDEELSECGDIIPKFLKDIVKEHCCKWLNSSWDALLFCHNNRYDHRYD